MKQLIIPLITLTLSGTGLVSCKKGYTCACSNPSGFYDGFDIHDTKRRAIKKCKNYYMSQYDTVTVSEVHCEIQKGE